MLDFFIRTVVSGLVLITRRRPLAFGPKSLKHISSLGQPPANRGFLAVKDGGDFRGREVFHIPQDQNRPVLFRNLGQNEFYFLPSVQSPSRIGDLRVSSISTVPSVDLIPIPPPPSLVGGRLGGVAYLVNKVSPWFGRADRRQDRLELVDNDRLLFESGDNVHGRVRKEHFRSWQKGIPPRLKCDAYEVLTSIRRTQSRPALLVPSIKRSPSPVLNQ